jgi:hypothetical protein
MSSPDSLFVGSLQCNSSFPFTVVVLISRESSFVHLFSNCSFQKMTTLEGHATEPKFMSRISPSNFTLAKLVKT